jgi:hypothetical protein
MLRAMSIHDNVSHNFLKMKTFSDERSTDNRNIIYVKHYFFPKIVPFLK